MLNEKAKAKANAKAQTITLFFPVFHQDERKYACYESEFISFLAQRGIVCGKDDTVPLKAVQNVTEIFQTIENQNKELRSTVRAERVCNDELISNLKQYAGCSVCGYIGHTLAPFIITTTTQRKKYLTSQKQGRSIPGTSALKKCASALFSVQTATQFGIMFMGVCTVRFDSSSRLDLNFPFSHSYV
jgi:hypothetical protein